MTMVDELREILARANITLPVRKIDQEERHKTPYSGVVKWSEVRCDRPFNGQVAHCADEADAALIVAALNNLTAQDARVKELEGALRPFANVGDVFLKSDANDDSIWTTVPDDASLKIDRQLGSITVGDYRRARAALDGEPG